MEGEETFGTEPLEEQPEEASLGGRLADEQSIEAGGGQAGGDVEESTGGAAAEPAEEVVYLGHREGASSTTRHELAQAMMPIAQAAAERADEMRGGAVPGDWQKGILAPWYKPAKRLHAVDMRVVLPFLDALVEAKEEAWLSTDRFESQQTLYSFMRRLFGVAFMGPKGDNEKSFWHALILSINAQRQELGLVGTYPWRRIYYTRSAQLTVPRGSEHTVTLKRGNFLVGQQLRDPQDQGVREGLLKAVRTVTGDIGGMNEAPVVEAALNAYQELWDSHETRRFVIGQPRTPKVKKAKKRKEQQGGGEDDHIPPRKRRRKGGDEGDEIPLLPFGMVQQASWEPIMPPYVPVASGMMPNPYLSLGPVLCPHVPYQLVAPGGLLPQGGGIGGDEGVGDDSVDGADGQVADEADSRQSGELGVS